MTNLIDFFNELKILAETDLSLAHIRQHRAGAQAVADTAKIFMPGPGAYSVWKPTDTLLYKDGRITGKKHWVSDAPNVQWAAVGAREDGKDIMVLVEIDQTKVEMVPTQGLEKTYTAHVNFDSVTAHKVYDRSARSEFFKSVQIIDVGFFTNHCGIAQALYRDIDSFTTNNKIQCNYNKNVIKLELDIVDMLWNSRINSLNSDFMENHSYWRRTSLLYSYAKKVLLDTTKLVLEFTGSGIYQQGTAEYQRYQDALIYCSHMKNLYRSLDPS